MEEKAGLEFASTIERRMHACGHDTHSAMLAGAARMLSRAETRSAIERSSFGKAVEAGLPDVIDQVIAGGIASAIRNRPARTEGAGGDDPSQVIGSAHEKTHGAAAGAGQQISANEDQISSSPIYVEVPDGPNAGAPSMFVKAAAGDPSDRNRATRSVRVRNWEAVDRLIVNYENDVSITGQYANDFENLRSMRETMLRMQLAEGHRTEADFAAIVSAADNNYGYSSDDLGLSGDVVEQAALVLNIAKFGPGLRPQRSIFRNDADTAAQRVYENRTSFRAAWVENNWAVDPLPLLTTPVSDIGRASDIRKGQTFRATSALRERIFSSTL